jgi:8-oxo-dGTP pyrophosphatase MutT (NUDIX family)
MALPEFSILIPVYNEAENIAALLRGLQAEVPGDYEILVVYDFDEDSTLPAIRRMEPPVPNLRLIKNTIGRGVVNAIRAGFAASDSWLGVVVTMGDRSDPPSRIPALVAKLRQGYDVVAGSRYMAGGQQIGGPKLKGFLSRTAGRLAYWLTGVGIHDVTTNFRGYSRRLISQIPIESRGGFELGLELTVKCHLRGWRVAEVPSTWHDRSAGASRFRLFAWLPGYLRWYLRLLTGDPLGLSRRIRKLRDAGVQPGDHQFFGVYELPDYGWTVYRYKRAIMVLPVTAAGKLVLIRVHRPNDAPGAGDWEFPGGALEPGEGVLEAARRELNEETGYETADVGTLLAGKFEAIPGMGSYPHEVVLFRDCVRSNPVGGVGHEGILEVDEFTPDQVTELVAKGRLTSLPTVAGIWLLQEAGRVARAN